MTEELKQGEEWASRALLLFSNEQAPIPVTITYPDVPAVQALLQRYFELVDEVRARTEMLRSAGAVGGKATTPAKTEACRLNGQKAGEAHRRRAELRRVARAAEELKQEKKPKKRRAW